MPWWGWAFVCIGVSALAGLAFRKQLLELVKVAKAGATDERFPRPLRWALVLAVDTDLRKVKVGVEIFSRETPVVLDFTQATKLEPDAE